MRHPLLLLVSSLLLTACDLPFLADEQAIYEAKREAEGKAIGGACRHSARALEECYERNTKVSKAAIFAGWRDMDGYMRENNIPAVAAEAPEPIARESAKPEEKQKAAEAPAAEAGKAKSAATPGKKSARSAEDAPTRQNLVAPGGKVAKHIA